MAEIIADYCDHVAGEREVVDWDRHDGTHYNVPLVYLRKVSAEDYLQQFPHMRGKVPAARCYFWEVSVD